MTLDRSIDLNPFSLAGGGPLYRCWRLTGLSGEDLGRVPRRLVVALLIAWVPLLALTSIQGTAWGGTVVIPFLRDVDTNARFLVALPLLIMGEWYLDTRLRPVLEQFADRGLVPAAVKERFDDAISSATRLRDSWVAEALMLALIYGIMLCAGRHLTALDVGGWFGATVDGRLAPSPAGWWMGCVSIPLFQFLLLRWLFRIVIWGRLLWRISRIELTLVPTHPDKRAGLGFLFGSCVAFYPLVVSQGALLSGFIGNRILFGGASLTDFKIEIAAMVAITTVLTVAPLSVFTPMLYRNKRRALREYGLLAQRYVCDFDHKWVRSGASNKEALIGSSDIQSLADLAGGYDTIRAMTCSPVSRATFIQIAACTLVPLLPLTLTMFSVEELLGRLFKVLF